MRIKLKGRRGGNIFEVQKPSASTELSWSWGFSPSRWLRWSWIEKLSSSSSMVWSNILVFILRLCIGYDVQFCPQFRRRPCSTPVFFHWPGMNVPELKSVRSLSSGELDSQGPRVSCWDLARLGCWEYVGTRDSLCQWHFSRLLHRWVQCAIDKKVSLFSGGSVFLSLVHRVHVGVARSLSGSPWGPYTDPLGILHIMTTKISLDAY